MVDTDRQSPAQFSHEESLFAQHCQGCHLPSGDAVGKAILEVPAIRKTLPLLLRDPAARDFLVQIPGVAMAPVSDSDLARLMNWLIDAYSGVWPADFEPYTVAEVAKLRAKPLNDVIEPRHQIANRLQAQGIELPPLSGRAAAH